MPRGRKPRVPREQLVIAQAHDEQDVGIEVEIKASPTLYACDTCDRTFTTTVGLKRHRYYCSVPTTNDNGRIKEATGKAYHFLKPSKPAFTCKECNKKFIYKDSYKKHLKEIHSNSPKSLHCDKCAARCPNKKVLKNHLLTHDTVKTACPHCEQTFSRPYHLVRHLDQKGCNGQRRFLFTCEVCQNTFSRKDNLMSHLRWHITKEAMGYNCRRCSSVLRSFNALLRHNSIAHEANRHECDICGKSVRSRVAFVKHLLIHGEKNFNCEKCNFKCKSAEILRRHALRHAARKPHQCLLCERSFIQAHELTAHTFRHTGHSSIKCAQCGEAFPSRNTLRSHEVRVHEGAPELRCSYKGCKSKKRAFINEISLRIHLKSHDANKPYKCPKCDKQFHIKAALSSHVLTHQWERARRCAYCPRGRAYIRGDLLLRHLRIKHPSHFVESLKRVRIVLGTDPDAVGKISKEEASAMINMIDALQEQSYSDVPIRIDDFEMILERAPSPDIKRSLLVEEFSMVMSEEELVESMRQMIEKLIDSETLECLGWPKISIDEVLESVLQQCGAHVAAAEYPRAARLRENAKQLFLRVIEDDTITRMMNTRSIDEVIRHVVAASE